jgi:hypothetical protein
MSANKRRFFLGSNALIVTVSSLISLGFLYSLSLQFQVQWDLSADGINTLAPETIAKIKLLEEEEIPLIITAFTAQAGRNDAFRKNLLLKDFLKRMESVSPIVQWEQIDYDRERFTAEELGVNEYGRVVLQRGDVRLDIKERKLFQMQNISGQRQAFFVGEPEIASAIGRLLSNELPVVYVLAGHGESNIKNLSPDGLSDLAAMIEMDGYKVEELQLTHSAQGESPEIPSDASMLLIASPKTPLSTLESALIDTYLDDGGNVLYLGDTDSPIPPFLSKLNVTKAEGVAVDKKTLFPYWDRPIPIVLQHPATRDVLVGEYTMVLSHPSAFILPDMANEQTQSEMKYHVSPFMRLSREAWLERGGDLSGGIARFDEGVDERTDMVMGAVIELHTGGKIAIVSDAEWVQNQLINEIPAASPLSLGLVYYLSGEERRLGLRPTVKGPPIVQITKPQMASVRTLSLFPVPLSIALFGLLVWKKRREE